MSLLADLVSTSRRVATATARRAKVRELAAFLKTLPPDEIETSVHFLSGEISQGKMGIAYKTLYAASQTEAAGEPLLSIAETDRSLAAIAEIRGPKSAGRREQSLQNLFSRATTDEQQFLRHLMVGELRQGALAGLMIDAIAAAAEVPVARVRQAAMYSQSLGAVAHAALREGAEALSAFQLELFKPASPMLAQTAADVAEALTALGGEAAFEWKLDGARIQAHKAADQVRIYTRALNEVTGAVPGIGDAVRALPAQNLVLDGEAIAFDSALRPHPFQITMRRFGRKLNVEALREELPISAFFFDCLLIDGRSIVDRPTRERIEALAAAVPASMRGPRLGTSAEPTARALSEAAIEAGHEGVMAKSLEAPYEA